MLKTGEFEFYGIVQYYNKGQAKYLTAVTIVGIRTPAYSILAHTHDIHPISHVQPHFCSNGQQYLPK